MGFPNDEQIEKIRKFDGHVVMTVQPAFWSVENDTAYYYGEHNKDAYPIKKLIDSGTPVGISTDFSVSPLEYSPATMVIRVAVTGGGDPQSHLPLSVTEAIRGFTVGSTATTSRNDTGVLYPGYKADMVVYEKDLYSVPFDEMSMDNPRVIATYVGGKEVYRG